MWRMVVYSEESLGWCRLVQAGAGWCRLVQAGGAHTARCILVIARMHGQLKWWSDCRLVGYNAPQIWCTAFILFFLLLLLHLLLFLLLLQLLLFILLLLHPLLVLLLLLHLPLFCSWVLMRLISGSLHCRIAKLLQRPMQFIPKMQEWAR